MSISYGTYRGCEVYHDELGWYYAAPAPMERVETTVSNLRMLVRVDDPDDRGLRAVIEAIKAARP